VIRSTAYNVIFLASVVTILFNVNPLMRFDGYYLLSDLAEIPNLRQRSFQYLLEVLKRPLLGLSPTKQRCGLRLGMTLLTYGVAAAVYRVFLLAAIAAILVSKMFLAGVVLGVVFLGGIILTSMRRLTTYLWYAEEAAPKRWRAVTVSLVVLIVIPAALVFVPVHSHIRAAALVGAEYEAIVRAKTPGFLEEVNIALGKSVRAGDLLAELNNDEILEQIAQARANLAASETRRDAFRVEEPVRALQEAAQIKAHEQHLQDAQSRLDDLRIRVPRGGEVVACVRDSDIGSFFSEGQPVATIAAGRRQVRAILTEDEIARAQPRVGDHVAFRTSVDPSRAIGGVISRIAPAGSRTIELGPLTHLGGGDIAVDPATYEATEPYFEVTVGLPAAEGTILRFGTTGVLRLASRAEPVAKTLGRRFVRFWNRMIQG
jgi:putative peptide zinc metalloprotease protein